MDTETIFLKLTKSYRHAANKLGGENRRGRRKPKPEPIDITIKEALSTHLKTKGWTKTNQWHHCRYQTKDTSPTHTGRNILIELTDDHLIITPWVYNQSYQPNSAKITHYSDPELFDIIEIATLETIQI